MAVSMSLTFPALAPRPIKATSSYQLTSRKPECSCDPLHSRNRTRSPTISITRRTDKSQAVKAVEESKENTETETASTEGGYPEDSKPESPITESSAELGAEIKEAMKRRKEEGREGNLLSGVVEEIGEIEWPAFSKVLGTTGVVLGVIAGSSVVLLTVNAVLAELSDQLFAGKGFQDFFT